MMMKSSGHARAALLEHRLYASMRAFEAAVRAGAARKQLEVALDDIHDANVAIGAASAPAKAAA